MDDKKILHYKDLLLKEKKVIIDEARKSIHERKSGDKDKLKNLEDDAFYESEDLLRQTLSIFKKRKLGEIDIGFSINQTPEEKKQGYYRCGILKQRHDDYSLMDEVMVLSQLKIGRPYISSYHGSKKNKK